MTDRTGHTTEPLPATDPGHTTGTPAPASTGVQATTSGRIPGAATGDSKGLEPKLGGVGDLSVPPAPRAAPAVPPTEHTARHEATSTAHPLIPRDDQDALSLRMQQAVTDFVESPRRAVEEADNTFDRIVSGLTEALAERRRVLRASWQGQDTDARTEELRIALQRYRDISEQLLKI
ncbi:hypothetical protein ACFYSH_14130 [Streptomyces sp. NPDC005791]|uniref:hypothetical protein n=1 Tax=unclassified Streptomyces TaxID=2593676 RepID=UPI0034117782